MAYRNLAVLAGAIALASSASAVLAGPIYWTPSHDSNSKMSYSDGQSDNGLYGNPTVVGDTFQFLTPHDFSSEASSSTADTTSDRLSVVVNANPGGYFSSINVTEFGDWSILGTGTVKDTGALFVTNLTPGHFGVVYSLTPTVSYTNTDTNVTVYSPTKPVDDGSGTWKATYILNLPTGVTSAQIVLNNILQTSAGASSTSYIEKKGISITAVDPALVPEPASMAILVLCGGMAVRRRRPTKAA